MHVVVSPIRPRWQTGGVRLSVSWLVVLVAGCVSTTADVRARATSLEAQAPSCESFGAFEAKLAKERQRLDTAPGEALVPASQALSNARRGCAKAVIDRLFELQQSKGREAAVAEVEALTKALGVEQTTALLRARWGREADGFLAEVMLSGFAPGPTPDQPAPKEPTHSNTAEPKLPGDESFGEGASCLRRSAAEAASCLAAWRRDGADEVEHRKAVEQLVARVTSELKLLEDDARAVLLGDVLRELALPKERPELAPLFLQLRSLTDVLVKRAEALAAKGETGRAAVLVRPLLVVDESRRRVEPLCATASLEHSRLATDARQRVHAAQVHRALSAWFLGKEVTPPSFEPGRWDDLRWSCKLAKPVLPKLPAGVSARLVARCRELPKQNSQEHLDPSMRTNDFEASVPRIRVDADVSMTCGGKVTTKRLSADEVLIDPSTPDLEGSRLQAIEGALQVLVLETEKQCRAESEREVAVECARLAGDPLDVVQAFTRHALRLGAWPACFSAWFEKRYGVPPPALH